MTTASTKIVIVAGNRYTVPAETDNEAIRQQLIAMGFADVASAEIKKGTDGEAETVEFVKKAGTKGLDAAALAALLARVPPLPVRSGAAASAGMHPADVQLLRRLATGQLTFEQALEGCILELLAAADMLAGRAFEVEAAARRQGEVLCQRCDSIPAAAAAVPSGW